MARTTEVTYRVLVVEDEPAISESIAYALETEGMSVETAYTVSEALARVRKRPPSLVLLDVMLPGGSGLDVCREIRAFSDVPIIVLSARDSEADKVAGLELGADDYVTKPFSMRELIARVRSHIRRAARSGQMSETNEVLRGGPVELDVDAHEVRIKGEVVPLRPKEFDLLETLMRRKGRLATRETLLSEVWGASFYGDTRTLGVHVKRLRHKIEEDYSAPLLTWLPCGASATSSWMRPSGRRGQGLIRRLVRYLGGGGGDLGDPGGGVERNAGNALLAGRFDLWEFGSHRLQRGAFPTAQRLWWGWARPRPAF